MERGELERMGDSLGPGAIVKFVDRRLGQSSADLKPLYVQSVRYVRKVTTRGQELSSAEFWWKREGGGV
jgi:hypothetical protein